MPLPFNNYFDAAIAHWMTSRSWWVGLFTTAFDGNQYASVEVTGKGYRRMPVQVVRVGNAITNADTITFPEAQEDWGTIQGWGYASEETGGDFVAIRRFEPEEQYTVRPGFICLILPATLDREG